MKIYMAGCLFTVPERIWNKELATLLRNYGHEVFLPQESEENLVRKGLRDIFESDVSGVEWADVVLGWVEGPDPDSGTCWELGYGKGLGKITIAYTTDLRFQPGNNEKYHLNLMITESVHKMLYFKPDDISPWIAQEINEVLKDLSEKDWRKK
jgi:nucleoside 2-deoxyribosyltransferase